MRLKQIFVMLLIINTLALIGVVIIISEYQRSIKQLELAYQMQHRSLILADELRQSSDDLTRMARTYVVTGNEMFEKQFHMVLDIRNGKLNRPKNYNRIYWDFQTLDGSKPILDGKMISLRELMIKAGFPNEELELLFQSAKESDDLTHLETNAMNAVKGIFQDENGEYTIKGKPNLKLAAQIMHGEQYHRAKMAIMKPLDDFYQAFETRTQNQVNEANKKVKQLEKYVGIAIFLLIVLVLFSFYTILSRIIHPLEAVKKSMIKLAQNKMDTKIPESYYNDEVGEMISAVEVFKDNAIKLIDSEQQNKLLLDLAGEGIFGLDEEGRFTFLNPMACKLLGYKSSELIGKYIYETIDESIKKEDKKDRKLMLLQDIEKEFINKHKKSFPIDYVSTPIYSKIGLVDGSVVVFSDKTQRKQNEDSLKKATEIAKAANHSKSVFLANMSHELRTPLNAILGFTNLLEKSKNIDEKEKENLNIVQNSGKHLLTIINEILEFSKIEAGKVDIRANTFELEKTIEDVRQMFTSRFEDKGISFEVIKDENLPKAIECDELRFRQVIINLLGNALKFTQKGSVKVEIKTKTSKLYVSVKDTGAGITKENQKLIFKPFEQIQQNKYTKKGTGLGLAITKELVCAMGGEINVSSSLGKGSEFSFFIEYKEIKDYVIDTNEKQEKITKLNLDGKEYNILVVDDIYENRKLLVSNLALLGFNTIEAVDGSEVLEILEDKKVDFIFLDMLMPKLSGIKTIELIKQDKRFKDIPIGMISANVFKEDEENALKAGADVFLRKPLEYIEIIHALQKYLNLEFITQEKEQSETINTPISNELLDEVIDYAKSLDTSSLKSFVDDENLDKNFREKIKKYSDSFDFDSLIKYCQNLAVV